MADDGTRLERHLVEKARAGDNGAFEELVRMYQRQIYAFLYRLSGSMEDAMELTQSSFVKAWLSIGRFRGDSSFRTYLYRIAANAWRNTLRGRARRRTVDMEMVPLVSGDNPHDEAARAQEDRRLWRAVEDLPPRQREALVLRVREGLPFGEVARIMGCSVGSAKASYHHAVGKLRESLGEDER